ncbi:conserved hypothetical protein [Formosa agariphila KMM 3901]|uniref:Uncharacterized protein n=1 Tax=Formosa agariphila (strain DSM 15362 / KCTC 12365 / LMG 23005 / KMM 3901 / M-2Alg 35-1) TaxID=1347342 RepID=T2KRW0_FORAG|nr:hypothetical protein [Formosa agariphila]CDF81231.1 conserved hypothetical protein [Formosa agariphila KMM 3901]
MNTNLPENSNSNLPQKHHNSTDEVDLIVLFNYIGKGFSNFFKLIGRLFEYLFKLIIYALKPIVIYAKIIALVMVIAAISGYFIDKNKPTIYGANMIVKPYYDSKFPLINSISYYNALIENGEYNDLSEIFKIDLETAESIKSFDVGPGPESETDLMLEYEEFLLSLDSSTVSSFSYEKFIERRDIYSTKIYEIKVEALKNDIFKDLEQGLNRVFENTYSQSLLDRRNKVYKFEEENLTTSLNKIDSLQKVYISVLKEESKSQSRKGITIGDGLSFEKDKSVTKEYELLNKEVDLRVKLVDLEANRLDGIVLFETVSGFQNIGYKVSNLYKNYMLTLPILAFLLIYLLIAGLKIIKFIKNYEG